MDCPTCAAHIEPRDGLDALIFAALEGLKCPRCGSNDPGFIRGRCLFGDVSEPHPWHREDVGTRDPIGESERDIQMGRFGPEVSVEEGRGQPKGAERGRGVETPPEPYASDNPSSAPPQHPRPATVPMSDLFVVPNGLTEEWDVKLRLSGDLGAVKLESYSCEEAALAYIAGWEASLP